MSFASTRHDRHTLMSPEEIDGLIAQGFVIVIMEGKVLKLDAWLKYHPGGKKAILHQVGKDATVEINACVTSTSARLQTVC